MIQVSWSTGSMGYTIEPAEKWKEAADFAYLYCIVNRVCILLREAVPGSAFRVGDREDSQYHDITNAVKVLLCDSQSGELEKLNRFLHSKCAHPDYLYGISGEMAGPLDDGWVVNDSFVASDRCRHIMKKRRRL